VGPLIARGAPAEVPVIQQLRIYEIFERNKMACHARFRDHAMRIMRKYGFEFVATWEVKRITSAEHGDLVGDVEDRVLVPTPYASKASAA
jgi:hypothetical protein